MHGRRPCEACGLHGGPGNDEIHGGPGIDLIYGDEGDDRLFGEAGQDGIHGGEGNDFIDGGEGDDGDAASPAPVWTRMGAACTADRATTRFTAVPAWI